MRAQCGDGVRQVRTFPCISNFTDNSESIMWAMGQRKDKPKPTELAGNKMIP
jgi:hypothetical protein